MECMKLTAHIAMMTGALSLDQLDGLDDHLFLYLERASGDFETKMMEEVSSLRKPIRLRPRLTVKSIPGYQIERAKAPVC